MRVLRASGTVPPHHGQSGVAQELEHHDAARVLDEGHVEDRVAEQELRRWLGHVPREEDKDGDHDRVDELEAVRPRVVLQVLHFFPNLLLAQQRRETG